MCGGGEGREDLQLLQFHYIVIILDARHIESPFIAVLYAVLHVQRPLGCAAESGEWSVRDGIEGDGRRLEVVSRANK